jgi:hypothetical protein
MQNPLKHWSQCTGSPSGWLPLFIPCSGSRSLGPFLWLWNPLYPTEGRPMWTMDYGEILSCLDPEVVYISVYDALPGRR